MGCLKKVYTRRGPDAGASPEVRTRNAVCAHRITGYSPNLVCGGFCRNHCVPEVLVICIGAHIHVGIIPAGSRAPGGDLYNCIYLVNFGIFKQQLGEKNIIAGRKSEPAPFGVDNKPVVSACLRIDLILSAGERSCYTCSRFSNNRIPRLPLE